MLWHEWRCSLMGVSEMGVGRVFGFFVYDTPVREAWWGHCRCKTLWRLRESCGVYIFFGSTALAVLEKQSNVTVAGIESGLHVMSSGSGTSAPQTESRLLSSCCPAHWKSLSHRLVM